MRPSMNVLPSVDGKIAWSPPAVAPAAPAPAAAPQARGDGIETVVGYAVAALMFLAALPVMLLAGLLVKLTSPGPALYWQHRVGRYGRIFKIWKIRTMTHNCEAESGPKWAAQNDERITRIGKILRKTHIDELPQLWNVLRGDMNLIGPRPERPEFVGGLGRVIERYSGRLVVKPGLTGLAQIQLPPDRSLLCVRKKLAIDLVYVEKRGLWLDLRLMTGTGLYLLGVSFAAIRRLLGLPASSELPASIVRDDFDISALHCPVVDFSYPAFALYAQRPAPVVETEYARIEGEVYS